MRRFGEQALRSRRAKVTSSVLAAAAALALVAFAPGAERSAVPAAAAQAPSASGPPRVYVIVLDGLRPQEVGSLTPTLSALRAQGTWYEQARAVFPAETLPNHVAMMTGKLPQDNGVVANQWWPGGTLTKAYMDRSRHYLEAETIVSRLEKACATRGDVATATVQSKTYLDNIFRGEPAQPADVAAQREADFHWFPQPLIPQSDHAPDQFTMDAFLGWVDRQPATLPQFAYVNLGDVDRSGHADQSGAATGGGLSAARQAALTDTDQQVKRLVDELKARGAWDETTLLFASDHGMDWGPQSQDVDIATALAPRFSGGYASTNPLTSDFLLVDGGGSGLVYVHRKADVAPIARRISEIPGVAFVATRDRVPGLDGPTLAELGIDHPFSPDIEVFADPGYRAATNGINPLPGNHGHPVTQQSTLFVSGGHPALADQASSVGGAAVYDPSVAEARRFADPAGGPGNLSIAPTVAALFGLSAPAGGYAVDPLTEAFDRGALARDQPLCGDAPAPEPAPPAPLDDPPPPAQAPGPLLTASAEVASADTRRVTYELTAHNHGAAPAEGVTLRADVPQNTAFASAEPAPAAPPACPAAAGPGTRCAWVLGDVPAGASRTVRATYDLTQSNGTYTVAMTATVAAPGLPDSSDADRSLTRRSDVVTRDAFVQSGGSQDANHGACDVLRVGRDGAASAFVMSRTPAALAVEPDRRVERVFAAELAMTVKQSPYTDAGPGRLALHRTAVERWDEGAGGCAGQPGRDDELRPGRRPGAASTPVARAAVGAGGLVRFDVTEELDTLAERVAFSGFEVRDGGSPASGDGTVALASREGADADRPRLITVFTFKANSNRCIDADAETVTRPSDGQPRLVARITDGTQLVSVPGGDACSGVPVAGQPVIWEVDSEGPDVYFSNLAGTPWAKEPKTGASMGPDRAITVTGGDGTTFVGVRQDRPYAGERAGENRIAAIRELPTLREGSEGEAEPDECPAGAQCSGEGNSEDDVRITWTAASPPGDRDGDGVADASDGCPSQPGPPSNGGCPPAQDPPASDRPPAPATAGATPGPGDGAARPAAGSSAPSGTRRRPPSAVRAVLTRRVERRRLRIRCALRGATVRSCVVRVLVRRRGRLRVLRTVRIARRSSVTVRLPRDRRLTLRATITDTAGRTYRTTRTLTRTRR